MLRRWGEGLQVDRREEVAAAGRAILLLVAEIGRLHVLLWDKTLYLEAAASLARPRWSSHRSSVLPHGGAGTYPGTSVAYCESPSPDPTPSSEAPLVLALAGRRVELSRDEVVQLRDAAAAEAGYSSRARDLSLLLDRALANPTTLAPRPGELRTLAALAHHLGLTELVGRLG